MAVKIICIPRQELPCTDGGGGASCEKKRVRRCAVLIKRAVHIQAEAGAVLSTHSRSRDRHSSRPARLPAALSLLVYFRQFSQREVGPQLAQTHAQTRVARMLRRDGRFRLTNRPDSISTRGLPLLFSFLPGRATLFNAARKRAHQRPERENGDNYTACAARERELLIFFCEDERVRGGLGRPAERVICRNSRATPTGFDPSRGRIGRYHGARLRHTAPSSSLHDALWRVFFSFV